MYEPDDNLERHVVVRWLGAGRFADVYLARHRETNRLEAVKVLKGAYTDDHVFVRRFRREAQQQARLRSKYVVQVFDAGGGTGATPLWIAMEYMDAGSLEEFVHRGSIPAALAAEVGRAIGGALDAAHAHGVLHRDVKPANILLSKEGDVKLSDFGIASAREGTALTGLGEALGTWAYAAPEQLAGTAVSQQQDQQAANAADTYALASVLHELLTGKPPFGQFDGMRDRLYAAVVHDRPRSASADAGSKVTMFDALIVRALSKAPGSRPSPLGLGSEFAERLERSGLGVLPLPVPLAPRPRRRPTPETVRLLKRAANLVSFAVLVAGVATLTPAGGVVSSLFESENSIATSSSEAGAVNSPRAESPPEPTDTPRPRALKNAAERALAEVARSVGEIDAGCESDPQIPKGAIARVRCQAGVVHAADETNRQVNQSVLDQNEGNPDSVRFSYIRFRSDKGANDYFERRRNSGTEVSAGPGECAPGITFQKVNLFAFCRIGDRAYIWWTYAGRHIVVQADAPLRRAADLDRTWSYRS